MGLAESELVKLPGHVRARRGNTWNQPRFERDVWEPCPPSTERARDFDPEWDRVDAELERLGAWYWDEYSIAAGIIEV